MSEAALNSIKVSDEFEEINVSNIPTLEQLYNKCVAEKGGALCSQKEDLDKWIDGNIKIYEEGDDGEREHKKRIEELRALLTYYYLDEVRRKALFSKEAANIFKSVLEKENDKFSFSRLAQLSDGSLKNGIYKLPETTFSNVKSRVTGYFTNEQEREAGSKLATALSIVTMNLSKKASLKQEFIKIMESQGCRCNENGKKLNFIIAPDKKFEDVLAAVNGFIKDKSLSISETLKETKAEFPPAEAPAMAKSLNGLGKDYSKNISYLLSLNGRIKEDKFKTKVKEQLDSWDLNGVSKVEDVSLFCRGLGCLDAGDKRELLGKLNSIELSGLKIDSANINEVYTGVGLLDNVNLSDDKKNELKSLLSNVFAEVKGIENRLPEKERNKLVEVLGRNKPKQEEKKEEIKNDKAEESK